MVDLTTMHSSEHNPKYYLKNILEPDQALTAIMKAFHIYLIERHSVY